jgi:hypothetical protein
MVIPAMVLAIDVSSETSKQIVPRHSVMAFIGTMRPYCLAVARQGG